MFVLHGAVYLYKLMVTFYWKSYGTAINLLIRGRKHWNTAMSPSSNQRILLVNLLEWYFGLWIDNDATAFKRLDPNFLIADFLLPLQISSSRWNTILTRLLSRSVALSVETYLLFEKSIFKGEPVYSGVNRTR